MKREEIKRLVAKSENAAVEFKRAKGGVPADFWPSYSAFANTDGGDAIFSRRERRGRREAEQKMKSLDEITLSVRNHCR